jgi:hypothetical protein
MGPFGASVATLGLAFRTRLSARVEDRILIQDGPILRFEWDAVRLPGESSARRPERTTSRHAARVIGGMLRSRPGRH